MHSLIFGGFPIKPGYISLIFCVARNEQKGELEMKNLTCGMLLICGACLLIELQMLGTDLQIRKLENRINEMIQAKEDAE